jgi:hypothetical protein
MTIKKFTIYGERCSGTNYLEDIILKNFNIDITWEYGWKHFPEFNEEKLKNADDTLFICIVRDINKWLNSFYKELHHHPLKYVSNMQDNKKINSFLNDKFFSVSDHEFNYKKWENELMIDRNIYTGERYKNIFEMRHIKLKYLLEDLPKKVKNYIFIRYEDLIDNFEETMWKIKNKGLIVKNINSFPLNSILYKNNEKTDYTFSRKSNNINLISDKKIYSNKNFIPYYEKILKYI